MTTFRAICDIINERRRQHETHGRQVLPDGTGDPWDESERDAAQLRCHRATLAGTLTWRDILEEEVAEVFAETNRERLREELVQVAAVACQWIEALDEAD